MLKFIEGLPEQLAFFVRASSPVTVESALTQVKAGKAYSYRKMVGVRANHATMYPTEKHAPPESEASRQILTPTSQEPDIEAFL